MPRGAEKEDGVRQTGLVGILSRGSVFALPGTLGNSDRETDTGASDAEGRAQGGFCEIAPAAR